MPNIPIVMPKLGQTMVEGTVVEWHYADGAHVEKGELLFTVETDKATYDLEATASGTLHILVDAGEEVAVGALIGETGDAAPAPKALREPPATPASTAATALEKTGGRVLASPRAKRLAAEQGVDLASVAASSADGVISADDVERALASRPAANSEAKQALPGFRKTIARRLQQAWQTIPHIVQMIDVEASALDAARRALSASLPGITLNDLIVHSAAQVMATMPELNVTLQDDALVQHNGVAIGFAVDTPRGLMVPVIRNADRLAIGGLVGESRRLVNRARDGRLDAADMGQASLTVSNLGMFGIRAGTPVINPGESCLVFVGTVEPRAVVVDGEIVVRPMMTLSIAYDHRITDGVAASRFSQGLKKALEELPGEAPVARPAGVARNETDAASARHIEARSDAASYTVNLRSGAHAWTLDESIEDGGSDRGPDPVRALLGALVSCMTIAYKAAARRRDIVIERIEAHIESNAKRHLESIRLRLDIWSDAATADLEALLQRAERGCYVSRALDPAIELEVELRHIDAAS